MMPIMPLVMPQSHSSTGTIKFGSNGEITKVEEESDFIHSNDTKITSRTQMQLELDY